MYYGDDDRQDKKSVVVLYIVAIVVVLLGSVGGGYYLISNNRVDSKDKVAAAEKQTQSSKEPEATEQEEANGEEDSSNSIDDTDGTEEENLPDEGDLSAGEDESAGTAKPSDENTKVPGEGENATEDAAENEDLVSDKDQEIDNDKEINDAASDKDEAGKEQNDDESVKETEEKDSNTKNAEDTEDTQDTEADPKQELIKTYKNADGIYSIKSTSGENLYAEAGNTEQVVAAVSHNFTCAVVDQTTSDDVVWDKVDYYGVSGWIKDEDLIKIGSGDQAEEYIGAVQYVCSEGQDTVSVQLTPGEDSDAAVKLPFGTEISIETVESGWGEFEYDGQKLWIRMTDVSTFIPWSKYCVNSAEGGQVNIRSDANSDASVTGLLNYGDTLDAGEFKNGWMKVNKDGVEGWVSSRLLTPCEDESFGESLKANVENQTATSASNNNTATVNNAGNTYVAQPAESVQNYSGDSGSAASSSSGSNSSDDSGSGDELVWQDSDELEWQEE